MRLVDAQQIISQLGISIFSTNDIASRLQISTSSTTNILKRLVEIGYLVHLIRGLWGIADKIEPLMLPEYITAPMPSYISLQSALYYHGMIAQIPEIIYAVSLARTRVYNTLFATVSIHHIQPYLFSDYILLGAHNIKIATPEKALVDFCYLTPAKNYLFRRLPEIELPSDFNIKYLNEIIQKIPFKNRRTIVQDQIRKILNSI